MKLLLDEIVPLPLVRQLRELGCDAVHVRERGWLARGDAATWAAAQAEGRALVTFMSGQLLRLVRRQRRHAGLILVTAPALASLEALWRHLATALAAAPKGLAGQIVMCPPGDEAPRQLRRLRTRPPRLRAANDSRPMPVSGAAE